MLAEEESNPTAHEYYIRQIPVDVKKDRKQVNLEYIWVSADNDRKELCHSCNDILFWASLVNCK